MHRHEVGSPLPQGSSLESGLCCPGPSSLSRPHPPHARAHRDFAAWRLIRGAFAVRERRGDPRVVPSFRCTFLPDMPSSLTPESSVIELIQLSMSTLAFAEFEAARHSQDSRNPFHAGHVFRGFTGSRLLRPVRLLVPLYGSDWNTQPPGAFTSRLSTARSPSPLLDMTTTATGLLCWRDFSPAGMAASLAALEPDVPN